MLERFEAITNGVVAMCWHCLCMFVRGFTKSGRCSKDLKRSQKHEPRADTSRVDSLACKPSADLFITTIRFCFTLHGFTNCSPHQVAKKRCSAAMQWGSGHEWHCS